MTANLTQPTEADVGAFLQAIEHSGRRADAVALDRLFRTVTGWRPRMWGNSLIGYGSYHYVYPSGRSGDSLATGFSPRKAGLSVYIMPGYAGFGAILDRLGKHKHGKSCLNIVRLDDVDQAVLAELIRAGLADLERRWPVRPDP